jgi:integrase
MDYKTGLNKKGGCTTMPMSEIKARSAKATGKRYQLSDSDGLYLDVMPSGEKYWRYRYAKNGKRTWRTIGKYPAITLSDAREERNSLYRKLRLGVSLDGARDSFGEVARQWADMHDKTIKNDRDRKKKRARMDNHLLCYLENKNIREITSSDILSILARLAGEGKYDMMSVVRSIASQIFRFGIAAGKCDNDPTYALRGAIPAPPRRHYPTVTDPGEIGPLMRQIDAYPFAVVRCAMLFSVLTFARPGEIRHAEWSEIRNDIWYVSAEKMKMRRQHIVPLSKQALDILGNIRTITCTGQYIFPSARAPKGNKPMSEAAVRVALRSMGYTNDMLVPHSFGSFIRHIARPAIFVKINIDPRNKLTCLMAWLCCRRIGNSSPRVLLADAPRAI